MKKAAIHFIVLVILGLWGCNPTVEHNLKKELQAELDKITASEVIPGATLCVITPDNKVWNIASGYADIENNTEMKPDDIMFSGSIGKCYVSTIILQLMNEGKLSLNDSVKDYFTDETWFEKIPNANDITLQMLLNHTTGIPRYVFDSSVWETVKADPDKIWSGKERLEKVFDRPSLHEAGKGWAYSDTNYIILGMIIEKVTGNDYYTELSNRCLIPFNHNYTAPANKRKIEGLTPGYCTVEVFLLPPKVGTNEVYPFNPQMEWTGGGVVTNVIDLATWSKQLYSGRVFNDSITALIRKPVPFDALGKSVFYGIGTIIWKGPEAVSYGHTGFFPGYRSIMQYVPEYDISLAMQINTDKLPEGMSLHSYLNSFKAILIGKKEVTGQ